MKPFLGGMVGVVVGFAAAIAFTLVLHADDDAKLKHAAERVAQLETELTEWEAASKAETVDTTSTSDSNLNKQETDNRDQQQKTVDSFHRLIYVTAVPPEVLRIDDPFTPVFGSRKNGEPPPAEWRSIEGQLLGIGTGYIPRYPYLHGRLGFGLSRKDITDQLMKQFPNATEIDEANGATGELRVLKLNENLNVAMWGAWNNLWSVMVSRSSRNHPSENEIDEWASVSDFVAGIASGDEGLSERVDANWVRTSLEAVKKTKKDTMLREDGLQYEVWMSEAGDEIGDLIVFRILSIQSPVKMKKPN